MKDEKMVVRMNEEKLAQVAGGQEKASYTACPAYWSYLKLKEEVSEDTFADMLKNNLRNNCKKFHDEYHLECVPCPFFI